MTLTLGAHISSSSFYPASRRGEEMGTFHSPSEAALRFIEVRLPRELRSALLHLLSRCPHTCCARAVDSGNDFSKLVEARGTER
jgi:hypothetical protein